MTVLKLTTIARKRSSYAVRSGMTGRAAKVLASAVNEKPEFYEDEDGNRIRVWKSSEMSSYSNADIADCLRNRVAVEAAEMLGTVPPSAIKYAVTKGWLVKDMLGDFFRVTRKASFELKLPLSFQGRKIPFAE